jgi:hypothetical protein
MSTETVRVAMVMVALFQTFVVAAQEIAFVRVTGERPSVFSRPVIDDRFLIGHTQSGDEFPLLRELAADLPQPFYQIPYRNRVGWIYGGSVKIFERAPDMLSPAELEAIEDAAPTPEERVGAEIQSLLAMYERERERVASAYDLPGAPRIALRDADAYLLDHVEGRLYLHLDVSDAPDRLYLPTADRLLFQILAVTVLERVPVVDSCRLVLHFSDRQPDPTVTLGRRDWENASDLSVDGFWKLVETENVDRLWEEP